MKKVKLRELGIIITGNTPKTTETENYSSDDICFIKPSDISQDEIKYINTSEFFISERARNEARILPPDSILVTCIGIIGKIAINKKECAFNQQINAIIPDRTKCLPLYLAYAIQNKKHIMQNMANAPVVPILNKTQFSDIEIYIHDIEAQKKIVNILDKVTDLIENRRQQLKKFDELIKARFVELTESTNSVPTRMGDIATYINGYAFKPVQWEESGYPIIRIQNLNNEKAPYNYYSGKLPDKYLIHNGDVLVSWATHLEAYIWKGEEAWLNQHIFKVVFDKIEVDKTYFVYACEEALRQAFRNAHGFKPTMEHIKKADFDSAIVRLPNIETQKQFAAFVEQTDKSKLEVQKSLEKLKLLKKALMQKYFG